MDVFLTIDALHKFLSFVMGAGIMTLNLALMLFGWDRVLNKKLVALGLPVIVLKYALLGFFLYFALRTSWLNLTLFSMGLAVPIVGYICYLLGKNKLEASEEDPENLKKIESKT